MVKLVAYRGIGLTIGSKPTRWLSVHINLTGFLPIAGVYKITNLVNGRIYIGQSTDIYARLSEHVKMLTTGVHHNASMLHDFRQAGLRSFEASILYEGDEEGLLNLESKYISKYQEGDFTLYNNNWDHNLQPDQGDFRLRPRMPKDRAGWRYLGGKRVVNDIEPKGNA